MVGVAILTVIAIVIIAWVEATSSCKGMPARWPDGNRCTLLKFLYDWQQLIGGFFAIGASIAAWVAIHRQVQQADRHESERNRQKRDAARAMLPLALSGITEYARACRDALIDLYRNRSEESIPKTNWIPPPVPSGAIADLRTMVEASNAPTEGRIVARILWRLQIQASRLQSLSIDLRPSSTSTIVTAVNIEQFIVDTIEVCALASAMFPFARGEVEYLPTDEPDLPRMFNAAMNLNIHHGEYPEVDRRLERQFGNGNDATQDEF